MTAHPTDFYIVHHLFSGQAFPRGPVWGTLTDGPADRDDVIREIREFNGDRMTLATLRVWHFQADVQVRDVTEDILAEAYADPELTDEERAEQHGDFLADLWREDAA